MTTFHSLADVKQLIAEELSQTENLLHKEMNSAIPLAEIIMQYAMGDAGKRFRPTLVLLCAKLFSSTVQEHHITAAAFVEFIHSASLLHDDVIDVSEMRRGKPTANMVFSNAATVLVGDFFYTRAFQLMVKTQNLNIINTMAYTTNGLVEGEILQLSILHNPEISEEDYYQIIKYKTAVLFSAACTIAGQIANASQAQIEALADFGHYLGCVFQIADDLLDYLGDAHTLGKSLGDDLSEGKPTLPLIRALAQLSQEEGDMLREIIREGKQEEIATVIRLLEKTDAFDYARSRALEMVEKAQNALAIFPDSIYKQALMFLAELACKRVS